MYIESYKTEEKKDECMSQAIILKSPENTKHRNCRVFTVQLALYQKRKCLYIFMFYICVLVVEDVCLFLRMI